ncbi:Ig-like domain-containing protein, partial [Roseomonas genomospecies 6]
MSSIAVSGTPAANASSVDYTVTFSESVTGVDTSDFTLTKTGTANGTVSAITGSGSSYTVTVNGISGAGTLRLDLNGTGTGIQDAATTPNAISGGFTTGGTHTVDRAAPSFDVAAAASSITTTSFSLSASLDEAGTIYYVLVADGATAPTAAEVEAGTASGGGAALKSGSMVAGTAPFTGSGSLTGLTAGTAYDLYVVGKDSAGNLMALPVKVDVTTAAPADTTPPTVSSIAVSGTPAANASSVSYTVTFSESVTGVDTSDFTLTKTGTANGTIGSISGSGSSYTVTVTGITGAGTLRLDLNGTGTGIQDQATTPNAISGGFTTGGTHTVDRTAPSFDVAAAASSITTTGFSLSASLDEAGTIYYVLVADGATAPTAAEVEAGTASGGGAALKSGSLIAGTAPFTGSGSLTGLTAGTAYDLYVVGKDSAGNLMASAVKVDVSTAAPADTTPPTVSSIAVSGTPAANASSISYTVTFSESVTGVDTSDFTLTKTGTANGTIGSISGSGTTYTVTVTGITGAGTLRLDLNGTGTGIQDQATTPNAIAAGFTSGGTHTVDRAAPSFDVAAAASSITTTGFSLSASLDEAGTIYYVLVADGATAPTAAEVEAGTASGGGAALKSGSLSAGTAPFTGSGSLTGLTAGTAYDLYVVGKDSAGNLMASPVKVDVSTAAPANGAPTNSVVPSVSGTAAVGNALNAGTGTWSDPDGDTLSYSYQWYRADDTNGTNAASISNATGASYTLTTSDAHKYLRVVVTANDGNSNTTTATSTYTAIANSAPTNSVAPTVSGTATVGNALSTTNGSWSDVDGDNR